MSIITAIEDLKSTLSALSWLTLVDEVQEAGAADYTLFFTLGDMGTVHNFGARKIKQTIILALQIKTGVDSGTVAGKIDTINEAIISDRRRSNTAQTTLVDTWVLGEDEGREGLILTTNCEVQVYES